MFSSQDLVELKQQWHLWSWLPERQIHLVQSQNKLIEVMRLEWKDVWWHVLFQVFLEVYRVLRVNLHLETYHGRSVHINKELICLGFADSYEESFVSLVCQRIVFFVDQGETNCKLWVNRCMFRTENMTLPLDTLTQRPPPLTSLLVTGCFQQPFALFCWLLMLTHFVSSCSWVTRNTKMMHSRLARAMGSKTRCWNGWTDRRSRGLVSCARTGPKGHW